MSFIYCLEIKTRNSKSEGEPLTKQGGKKAENIKQGQGLTYW